jgi:hypothetical protein
VTLPMTLAAIHTYPVHERYTFVSAVVRRWWGCAATRHTRPSTRWAPRINRTKCYCRLCTGTTRRTVIGSRWRENPTNDSPGGNGSAAQ